MGVVPSFASGARRFRFPLLAAGGLACSWLVACATGNQEQTDGLGDQYADPNAGSGGGGSGGMASAGTTSTAGTSGSGTAAGTGPGGSTAGAAGSVGSVAGSGGAAGSGGVGGTGGVGGAAGGGGAAGNAGAGGADACPTDPDKTAPGKCGCGASDTDSVSGASCVPLQDSLIHRYSFETDVNDSVGTKHGKLMGGATISGGALNLAGAKSGQYLDLPNGLVSTLTSVTLEAFVTWTGAAGNDWQRIFDFGSSDMAEDVAGKGNKYLFLSARKLRACYTSATPPSEIFTDSTTDLSATPTQLAVVVNGTAHTITLFLNGDSTGAAVPLNLPLSAINDVNNWLGRSQFAADDYFAGKISEFRIYNAALTGPQLKTSIAMGENTTYLKKP
jgi:Concanavalin A-like lectin/glucanases superfamily